MKIWTVAFLMIILMLSIVRPLDAQFSLGVNAGTTRMKFSGDATAGIGKFVPEPGFSSALRVDYRFTDAIALSLQPGYSLLRSKYKVKNDSGTQVIDSTQLSMNSISLPLHLIVWSENGRFYALAGMQLDYLLSLKGETIKTPYSTGYDTKDFYLYAQFGAGFILNIGKPYLNFEIRYSQGILDLTDPLFHQDSFLPRTKLTNINILVGIQWPLGRYSERYPLKRKSK